MWTIVKPPRIAAKPFVHLILLQDSLLSWRGKSYGIDPAAMLNHPL
jgi:hypothetical protein